MKAFNDFCNMPPEFWAFIKFVGDKLGYTLRKTKNNPEPTVKEYTLEDLQKLIKNYNINVSPDILNNAVKYITLRANILNSDVRENLMVGEQAKELYQTYERLYNQEGLICKVPHNLQTGKKKQTRVNM